MRTYTMLIDDAPVLVYRHATARTPTGAQPKSTAHSGGYGGYMARTQRSDSPPFRSKLRGVAVA